MAPHEHRNRTEPKDQLESRGVSNISSRGGSIILQSRRPFSGGGIAKHLGSYLPPSRSPAGECKIECICRAARCIGQHDGLSRHVGLVQSGARPDDHMFKRRQGSDRARGDQDRNN